jgi:predicted phosphoribosyltransferase
MGQIHEDPALRDRAPVFRDRQDAGERLGRYLAGFPGLEDPLVCPIPAGGVPVGIAVSRALHCPLRPLIVRKVQIPWNTEAGFGAIAWDGRVVLNEDLLGRLHLTPDQIEAAIRKAQANVRDRMTRFGFGIPVPDPAGHSCIIVDDGLASGYTMTAAIEALRGLNPRRVIVAVPTGSLATVKRVEDLVEELICLNIRTGYSFAVADAYEDWYDLMEEEAVEMLRGAAKKREAKEKGKVP